MTAVRMPATVVSISTVCQRRMRGMIACSVRPDEYRSTLLMANSWRITKIEVRDQEPAVEGVGQAGDRVTTPTVTAVATAAPSRDSSVDGT